MITSSIIQVEQHKKLADSLRVPASTRLIPK